MLVPSQVTIEVLSNGTAHMKPSVAIKTPHNVYLFNCPEGASRFIADLRIRSTNIRDIFITKNSWENIGGISSILLSKGKETFSTKLHGPYRVKDYLDCIRPFADADFNVPKYPNRVDEQTYDMEKYEDHALTVRYLPLTDFSTRPALDPLSVSPTDVAFLVTLKEAQRRINPVKLINLKVPNGPLIAKLKAGESVTIPDGRLIHPDDVLSDREEDRPHVLIVELDDIRKLPSLKENTCLQPFTSNKTQMNFVVHFTRDDVLNKPDYQTWLKSFGPQCRHVVANGSGKCLPHMESMYRNQILLNNIDEGFFPLLTPTSFNDVHGQDCPDDAGKQVVVAKPMQRFAMRGEMNTVDPVLIDLRRNELLAKNFESPEISAALEKYKRESSEVSKDEPFPRISFLGTSSAVPSKYRNVSSYLMELSDKAAIMVDCGEGTYGQLRVLYGDRHAEILANLKAIFVTHAHQDHMNGLYSLIIERHRIYQNLNRPYVPLIVVCNRNVKSPMTMFSRCFYNVESLVSTVDVTHRLPSKNSNVDRDKSFFISNITDRLPVDLYDAKEWNLQSAVSVHVHHTRMANGFIFTDNQGKKVVFSGDTMPCDLLAETGRGADILVHEATFGDDHEDSARKKKHSTMLQAITVGEKMKAKHVLLSHFSARYPKVPWLPEYLDERGNVAVAMDNFVVPFGRLPATSKLIPAYRELFKEDLFEIEVKQNQRRFRNEEDKEENGPAAKRRNLVGAERV
ncbi:hypothetical protein L596_024302 [Steinernema carpocapsae]|uniref:ribonuclease Z n=1 Tax=Steinernema carpocapsae TaxID=34508 RepID=A0A4V5ZZN8_STECR|nr:hypothetical protein L596_024302 [Steinernema carpocapsae]